MKICHISLALFPDHKDGSAKFARGVYEELKNRGYDIKLITGKWEHGFDDPNIITIDVPNSRFLWVPKFFFKVRKYLKNHEFDIIHANGSRGALPVMFMDNDYIANIHDLGPFEAQFTSLPILKWLERKNAQKASRIITCSDIVRYGIEKHMGASLDKMHNVYSAIDPKYKPDTQAAKKIKEKLGLKDGPVIFYVGRIAFYKGVEDIIKAFYGAKKEITDLQLVIGGKPTIKMEKKVKKWRKRYQEVHFVGLIPEKDMIGYYNLADVFCTYSHASEGFGLTPIEALACKTPVICSTMPAYEEVLQDYAYFVPPQAPKKLEEKFVWFFNHQEKTQNMVEEAQEFIKRYTWGSVVDKIEEVYEKFLENHKN